MKNLLYIVIGAGFLGIISSSASGFLTTETSDTLDNLYEENFYIDPESVEVGDDKVKVLLYQVNTNNAEKKINDCLNFYKSEYKDKTIECSILINQNIAVEMFLIKLLYLKNKKIINTNEIKKDESSIKNLDHNLNSKTVNQIKSVVQKEEQIDLLKDKNIETKSLITNIDELINLCNNKRELKLKYELENNVKLVSFKNNTIEIEFNEKLDKYFVKDLSEKLFQWTQTRWLISFSRKKGEAPKKIKEKALNNQKIDNFKKSSFYTELNQLFPDIEITEITEIDDLNN